MSCDVLPAPVSIWVQGNAESTDSPDPENNMFVLSAPLNPGNIIPALSSLAPGPVTYKLDLFGAPAWSIDVQASALGADGPLYASIGLGTKNVVMDNSLAPHTLPPSTISFNLGTLSVFLGNTVPSGTYYVSSVIKYLAGGGGQPGLHAIASLRITATPLPLHSTIVANSVVPADWETVYIQ